MKTVLRFVFVPALLTSVSGLTDAANKPAPAPSRLAVFQEKGDQPAADAPQAPVPAADKAVAEPPAFPFAIHLSSDGLLPGVIMVPNRKTGLDAPGQDLSVWFMQNGEVKSVAKPGVGGVFQAKGLVPGRYSLIASGKSGYLSAEVVVAAAPVRVSQVRPTKLANQEARTQFYGMAVPPEDLPMTLKIAQSYIPASAWKTAPTQLIPATDILTAEELQGGNVPAPGSNGNALCC